MNKHQLIIELAAKILGIGENVSPGALRYLSRMDDDTLVQFLNRKDVEPFTLIREFKEVPIPERKAAVRESFEIKKFVPQRFRGDFLKIIPKEYPATERTSASCFQVNVRLTFDEFFEELGGPAAVIGAFTYPQITAFVKRHEPQLSRPKWAMDYEKENYFLVNGQKGPTLFGMQLSNMSTWKGCFMTKGKWHMPRGRLFLMNNG